MTLLLVAVFVLMLLLVACPTGVKIVLPEGVQMSGSIGGVVYSHNRYGYYRRNRSVPVNPNTDRQVQVRNAVRALSIRWQNTLTQDQRDAWDTYAANVTWLDKQGQTCYLTGLAHYLRCNGPRLQSTIDAIDDAPTIFNIAEADTELAASASEATQQITVSGDPDHPWINEADAWCFVSMGIPQNASIKFFGGPWRLISALPGAGPPPWPALIAAAWPFAEGQRIWVRTRIARGDGRLSDFAQVNFLAAA